MASTYSPNLRLELIGTGEQQGTWGSTTNTNLGTLLEEAIGGYVSVTVTDGADTTLTTVNGGADQSRNMTINLTGALTAARNVICPAIEKLYVVKNDTTGGFAVTFKVSGQTGVSVPNGATVFLYVDGTDARSITGSLASQSASNVTITGGTITGITDLAIADGGTGASTASAAATNLGLGTGDSPQFAGVNVGNATDTTITRVSAGVIAVEGNQVPSPGSVAQGDVLYYDGTNWARLAAGTSGQYLKTNGASANPSWSGVVAEYYSQATAPSSPSNGAIWYDTDDGATYIYSGGEWVQVNDATVIINNNRGLFGGGSITSNGTSTSTIYGINISTFSTGFYFGNLTTARINVAATSNGTRAVFAGSGINSGQSNVIDYVTISTNSNAIDFGDLTVARGAAAACSNGTRAIFGGGSSLSNVIDYITIATAGNATDFGDLTVGRTYLAACSNGTRGVFGGGGNTVSTAFENVIDYVTISTTGNATDFGDLTVARYGLSSCSNGTRGIFISGWYQNITPTNVIDYITIATAGNATSFGSLASSSAYLGGAACSNGSRAVFGGGATSSGSTYQSTLFYVTISTTGNAGGFGNLPSIMFSGPGSTSGFYGA